MNKLLKQYLFQIIGFWGFLSILLLGVYFFIEPTENQSESVMAQLKETYPNVDFSNPIERVMFKEFYKMKPSSNLTADTLMFHAETYYLTLNSKVEKGYFGLTFLQTFEIMAMFLKFSIVLMVTLVSVIYLGHCYGLFRFFMERQYKHFVFRRIGYYLSNFGKFSFLNHLKKLLTNILVLLGLILFFFIGFTPAYVLVYIVKLSVFPSSVVALVLFSLISNGALILIGQKFYIILKKEHTKGYVKTAIVKGLDTAYSFSDNRFSFWSIFVIKKEYRNHVFSHIYSNAMFQYFKSLKESIAFVISSLIIVEMALNLQGYLSYELMQSAYNTHLDRLFLIVGLIFFLVKAIEFFVEFKFRQFLVTYENK